MEQNELPPEEITAEVLKRRRRKRMLERGIPVETSSGEDLPKPQIIT
jgi:hypothetical protein